MCATHKVNLHTTMIVRDLGVHVGTQLSLLPTVLCLRSTSAVMVHPLAGVLSTVRAVDMDIPADKPGSKRQIVVIYH